MIPDDGLPILIAGSLYLAGEVLRLNVVVGATIVVAAGLFTLWRQRVRAQAEAASRRSAQT